MREPALREEAIARALKAREAEHRLAAPGGAYPEDLEAIDLANAEWLSACFDKYGWPGRGLLGDDGAAAAMQLFQRAVSRPDVQRRGLALMLEAVPAGEANAFDAAHVADRIAVFEGRGQVFGTQLEFDGAGHLSAAPIADSESVDARRASIGLPPMAAYLEAARARAAPLNPKEAATRRSAFEAWAVRVGWREGT